MNKKTVIIGASVNPARYSFMAAGMLADYGHEIVPLGIRNGQVFGVEIRDIRKRPEIDDVDTVTLYIGPRHQPEWYSYIISLHPARVIFNPGTENSEFIQKVTDAGAVALVGCTLVMLRTNQY